MQGVDLGDHLVAHGAVHAGHVHHGVQHPHVAQDPALVAVDAHQELPGQEDILQVVQDAAHAVLEAEGVVFPG